MPQTNPKTRFWIAVSVAWFLVTILVGAYVDFRSTNDLPSYLEAVEFDLLLLVLNLPLIIGWGLWWKVPGLLIRVDDFFTRSKREDVSKERLHRMLADGLHLLNRPVKTELDFNRWKTDEKNWANAVYRELKTNFDESTAESFQAVESVQETDIVTSFNSEHNTRKWFLNKRLNNLTRIIN